MCLTTLRSESPRNDTKDRTRLSQELTKISHEQTNAFQEGTRNCIGERDGLVGLEANEGEGKDEPAEAEAGT